MGEFPNPRRASSTVDSTLFFLGPTTPSWSQSPSCPSVRYFSAPLKPGPPTLVVGSEWGFGRGEIGPFPAPPPDRRR